MKIETYAAHTHVTDKELRGKTVVVIDTLRATSTIITALYNGAEQIYPVQSVEQAMDLAYQMREQGVLLGGERNAEKVQGFDLGNSPLEYMRRSIDGKSIILSTTNGTQAMQKAALAKDVYIGALLNGVTVASALMHIAGDAVLLCAGTHGNYSMDDIITAGYIIYRMKGFNSQKEIEMDDLSASAYQLYKMKKDNLQQELSMCTHYNVLKAKGMDEDLEYCLKRDTVRILPVLREGRISVEG
ncbi:2-phosphosulfolactate phosphatase [Eubacteriales bacterium OttesenSCG-928-N14]|nr:2-phosphosulfolactate phosphatase [Eubacteriales bacterium OttesenSCG-928-N14]